MAIKGSKHSLGDIDHTLGKRELEGVIRFLIRDLQKLHQNHFYKRMIQQFTNVVLPVAIEDDGRLPYFSADGMSKRNDKCECVAALLGYVVWKFWSYYKKRDDELLTELKKKVVFLSEISKNGLDSYKTVNNGCLRWELAKT